MKSILTTAAAAAIMPLAVSPRLIGNGAFGNNRFFFDKPSAEGGGSGGGDDDELTILTKGVKDLIEGQKDAVKRSELAPLQKSLDDLIKDFKELKVGKDNAEDDKSFGFKNLGEFALAVYKAGPTENKHADQRLKVMVKGASAPSGVSQGYDPSLGFMFPPAFSTTITETPYETDDMLSKVRRVPMDASNESITLNYVDDQDRSKGTIRGGVVAYWKSEAEQMTGGKPKLRPIKLEPHELYAFCYATDKSLRNSPIALGSFLKDAMREAVALKIGMSIFDGDGVGKPRGLMNSPSKITVPKEAGQVAGAFTETNVAAMWKRMPAWMRSTAVWLVNQDCEDSLDLMGRVALKADGTATVGATAPVLYNAEKNTLKNRPIIFCEYCNQQGTEGDIVLWNPHAYLVATKAGQGPEMSPHLRFDFAETAFRVIVEIDGKSEYPTTFKALKGQVERSDIVTLQSRP